MSKFGLNLTISYIFTSNFSNSTSKIANPAAKQQDLYPVSFIYYFFLAHGGLCPPLGVLLRPYPWSRRLLKRCVYRDGSPH